MKLKRSIKGFISIFSMTLVACVALTYVWSIIFHDIARIDWETSFRLAIIFGILFTYLDLVQAKQN